MRLTARWLQYLDAPLPGGAVKGSKEVAQDWKVSFHAKHANAITLECGSSDDVFHVRFSSQEVRFRRFRLRFSARSVRPRCVLDFS